ncbi:unnamed protein product [Closterium sp. NIES-65]|nr:unnamed protein product [Closterium sp. NIES-65]
MDTLEGRVEDARRRHEAQEYGAIPWAVVEAGLRSMWAMEHPSSRPASLRPVTNEGGVDVGVNAGGGQVGSSAGDTSRQRGVIHSGEASGVQARGMQSSAAAGSSQGDAGGRRSGLSPMSATQVTTGGIAPSYGYFKFTPDRILVTPPLVGRQDILTWKEAIEPQLEMAGLIGFARGTVATPGEHHPDLRAEFRAVQLLTFTSTYQVTDDLFIAQIEGQLTHLSMGDEETATGYCNRARRILATIRMAGAQYSTASYVTHDMQGLSSSYNLLKRLSMAPSTTATLNEDNLTSDSDDDDAKGGRGRSGSHRPRRGGNKPRKEKQSTTSTSAKDADSSAGGKGRDDKTASCSLVGIVEPTVSLAPEAGEEFKAVAAAVQANPAVVLLDSGCSHHLMGTKEVFVDLQPSSSIKHVCGFNGALQNVQGRGTVALQGEAGKQVLIPDVLYVPGVRANLLSAGQLKEHGVKLQEDGDGMLLVLAAGEVLGQATYTGRVLCTDLRPCSATPTKPTTEVVALRAIVSATKASPDRMHTRLAHVGMDTIRNSAKNEVAIGLDLKSATGADSPCVSCVGEKLARHTFPDQGSDADDVLAVVHIDLCGPFRVTAKDGSLYFLLLKDRKTRYVWVKPVAKKSDALPVFVQWLAVAERQTRKSVLMLRSDRGGEFLGKQFTNFVNGKGIVHDLTCLYTPQQNGMAEREMRMVVESVRTMLLHMGLQHHWWHLALRQARGGKLQPKARWGLHLGVSAESKGWELLDIADNRVVTTSDVVFYESMSLEVWKSAHGPASGRMPVPPPTDTSTTTPSLLAEVGEVAGEDAEDIPAPCTPPAPPLVADLHGLTLLSASGDEGRRGASPVAPVPSIAGGQRAAVQGGTGAKLTPTGRQQVVQPTSVKETSAEQQLTKEHAAATPIKEQLATGSSAGEPTTWEKSAGTPTTVEQSAATPAEEQQDAEGSDDKDDGGDAEEVQPEPRRSGRLRRPPDFFVPAAFTTVYDVDDEADDLLYDDAEEDEEFPELDPDMLADPEHRWDISTMSVKEALASWKGLAVKAAMEEEIRSLLNMGTWELVKRPLGVNIMKNRWVLTTKYHIDDTVEREKARLVVKGFTQVYGADYDETFAPLGSYVTLRIFLSIVAVLNLNLMQLDMKNAFLQSKLDRVLYMHQPDYFNDGSGRVCRLLKSLYGLKQSPLLWYLALNDVLVGAGWKKSQVDEALYFKVGEDGVACWVLVYVDDLLAASSSAAMLKELKELLEATFELREISPVQTYLELEIVRDRSAGKLWLHQQGYVDKLRRRFIDEEQTGRTPKTPVSVDAYAELTFDDEEAQERQEEEYRQKSLELVGYVDADDAGDKQNMTSTGGYVFVYGGAAVSWSSQRIKCATLSSTESEYVAATEVGKEGRRLRFLLAEFRQLDAGKPTVVRVDNKLAITVAEGMGLTSIERRQAWLQHMVKRGKFSLQYIPTAEQPADFLTKALQYPAFNRCSVANGQVRLADVGDGDNDVQQ